jgi:hypothetical protein
MPEPRSCESIFQSPPETRGIAYSRALPGGVSGAIYTPAVPRRPPPHAQPARLEPTTATPSVDLVLYVSSASRYSNAAIRNCEQLLARFDRRHVRFEICDVGRQPERADADKVVYTPMLVTHRPRPRTYVLGDLSNATALVELLESCGLELLP